jgi:uncharacterized protein
MTSQERLWKVGVIVGVLLAVFLAVISIKEIKSIAYVGKTENAMNTISVNGKGEALVIPDIATFSFTINETAKTVTEAQKKATEKTNLALKGVREEGVADKDIKTLSYNINPHYEYQNFPCTNYSCPPTKSTLTGYDVSQTIEVKIRDLEKAGDLFTTIGANNVENLNGLNLTVDEIESVRSDAREIAIADARVKAEEIAKQLGVRLVRVTSFGESNNENMFYGRDMVANQSVAAGKAAPSPEIPVGEQKIVSNVSVTYEIR